MDLPNGARASSIMAPLCSGQSNFRTAHPRPMVDRSAGLEAFKGASANFLNDHPFLLNRHDHLHCAPVPAPPWMVRRFGGSASWLIGCILRTGENVVAFCNRPDRRLCSIMHGDFAQNRLQMNFDRRLGYVAKPRDLLIRVAFGQADQDLAF